MSNILRTLRTLVEIPFLAACLLILGKPPEPPYRRRPEGFIFDEKRGWIPYA